jgi:hypothetical protein
MFFALTGALIAQLALRRPHDAQLAQFAGEPHHVR